MPTLNKFEALDNESEKAVRQVRPIKPRPIFVDGVNNIQTLTELLNNTFADNYEIRILRAEQLKILPRTTETYSAMNA